MSRLFKKAKATFLSKAGRQGAPSARRPFATPNNKITAKARGSASGSLTTRKPIGKAKVVKNGAPLKTGKVKPNVNAKTGKKANFKLKGKLSIDQRLSNYFMSHSRKLRSVTNSPQSAPQAYKPRG